jgi:hypothetical protein
MPGELSVRSTSGIDEEERETNLDLRLGLLQLLDIDSTGLHFPKQIRHSVCRPTDHVRRVGVVPVPFRHVRDRRHR